MPLARIARFSTTLPFLLGCLAAAPLTASAIGPFGGEYHVRQKSMDGCGVPFFSEATQEWLCLDTAGGAGEVVRCSGHPRQYPSGWVLKVVFNYNTPFGSVCTAYLYFPNGELDDVIGSGDCSMLCSDID